MSKAALIKKAVDAVKKAGMNVDDLLKEQDLFFHSTSKKAANEIAKEGLSPQVGDIVQQAYGDVDDLAQLAFLSDKSPSAFYSLWAAKKGKHPDWEKIKLNDINKNAGTVGFRGKDDLVKRLDEDTFQDLATGNKMSKRQFEQDLGDYGPASSASVETGDVVSQLKNRSSSPDFTMSGLEALEYEIKKDPTVIDNFGPKQQAFLKKIKDLPSEQFQKELAAGIKKDKALGVIAMPPTNFGEHSLSDVATDFGNWIEQKTGYGGLIEALKREGAIKSGQINNPGYMPSEQEIQDFGTMVDKTADMASGAMGTVGKVPPKAIIAPTSAQGVQMSNQMGKTPFGKVIQVPNNTVKGYADGGMVQPQNTTWLGTPSYGDILSQQSPAIQLANQDLHLAEQVAPTTMLPDVASSVGNFMNQQGAARNQQAAQFGFEVPGAAPAEQAMPQNVSLGMEEQAAAVPEAAVTPQQNLGQSALNRYTQGMNAEAAAQGALGNEQALIKQQEQARMQEIEADYKNNFSALEAERTAIMDDIKANHIDANRFIGQMGGGARVGTAIGLLLSGFGSGMSGQPNMAMNFLQKQIDNDIYAQTQELGKKQNLLSATMQQFGNLKDASAMARVITQDIYKSKIEEAAAKSMDPVAKARAQQAIAEMEIKQAPVLQELARKQTVLNGMKSGKVKPAEAVTVLVPESMRSKALEEIGKVETTAKAVSDITKAMDEMRAINTVGNRITSPIQSTNAMGALKTSIMGAMKPIFGALSESDKVEAMKNAPEMLDSDPTFLIKVNNILRLARDAGGATPTLDAYGVTIDKSGIAERRKTLNNDMFKSRK